LAIEMAARSPRRRSCWPGASLDLFGRNCLGSSQASKVSGGAFGARTEKILSLHGLTTSMLPSGLEMIKRNDTKEADIMQVDNMTQHAGKANKRDRKHKFLLCLSMLSSSFLAAGAGFCIVIHPNKKGLRRRSMRPTIGIGTTQVERMTV
jgi:hypothetical protein